MAIKIVEYKPYSKGTLQGFLTVRLTGICMEIRRLTYHRRADGHRWIGLPSHAYEKGGETKYLDILRFYEDTAYWSFQNQTIAALDEHLSSLAENR